MPRVAGLKKFTMSYADVMEASNGLDQISGTAVGGELVFAIAHVGAALKSHVKTFYDERNALVTKFSSPNTDEVGEEIQGKQIKPEDQNAFAEAVNTLAGTELEVEFVPLKKSELMKYQYSPRAIQNLLPFIDQNK